MVRTLVSLGLLLCVTAGCSGVEVKKSVPAGSSYDVSDVAQAVRKGGLYVDLSANIYGRDDPDLYERLLTLMNQSADAFPVRFVDKNSADKIEKYHVVVWINPSTRRENRDICRYKGGVAVSTNKQRIEVAMGLCSGEKTITEASGSFFYYDVDPLKSNRYEKAIKETTRALFPKSG